MYEQNSFTVNGTVLRNLLLFVQPLNARYWRDSGQRICNLIHTVLYVLYACECVCVCSRIIKKIYMEIAKKKKKKQRSTAYKYE